MVGGPKHSYGETPEEKMIYLLAASPQSVLKSWQMYDINEFTFYTKANDSRSKCENSGVRVDTEDSTRKKYVFWVHQRNLGSQLWNVFTNSCIQMLIGETPTTHWGG
jgi:hypothetical protein